MILKEDLRKAVPCRNKEIDQILSLLGEPNEPVPPSIFVLGHKSSGKSHTIKNALEHLQLQHAIVSCVQGYTATLLFQPILEQLIGFNSEDDGQSLIPDKCEDMMDFITQLNRKAEKDEVFLNKKHVIVLEEAEYLRDMGSNLLPAFLKLQELTLLKRICVILVSSVIWDKFCPSSGLRMPIQIYFPQYTQSELLKILFLDRPSKYPEDFYESYLKLFISIFLRACRDVRELRYKAAVNFKKYCEPIESGKVDLHDVRKLWMLMKPHITASLEVVYMRTEMDSRVKEQDSVPDSAEHKHALSSSAKFALSFELPFYAKYLLIAAYLASYNSPKEDKKLFVKLSGRKKKQMPKQFKNRQTKESLQLCGPRLFDMDRLLAIFYAIMATKPTSSVTLLSQITTLVELQLLHRLGEDALDNPKFRCAVGLDFIIIIARTLDFTVTKYLVDYK